MIVADLWRKTLRSPAPEQVIRRFMLIALGGLLLITVPTLVIFYHYQVRMADRVILEQGRGILSSYNSHTRDSIEKGQRKSFVLAMNNIAQLEGVKYTTLYNDDRMMNYRSNEVTVGVPFTFDAQGNLMNPNLELYEQSRGMYLRPDWSLASRMDSPQGQAHRQDIMGQPCGECHYILEPELTFDQNRQTVRIEGQEVHFFEKIPVESRCLTCHAYWQIGEAAGFLGITMDRRVFLQQAFESTQRLIYFLLFNAGLVLAATFLVATMYRRVLITRRQLAEKSGRLAGLLDNSGQGFLSFGSDLLIEAEYSRECETFFGSGLARQPVVNLLFPGNSDEADRFSANIRRVLKASDALQRSTYISLLPRTFELNHRNLDIAYRLIDDDLLMLIITDITEKLHLEAMIAEEQTRLRLIVAAVTESDELFGLIEDYQSFAGNEFSKLMETADQGSAVAEIYRQIHTFKSLFGQLEFIHLPRSLHQFESDLKTIRDQQKNQRINRVALESALSLANQALEQDLAILKETLGETFFARRGHLSLSPEMVTMLESLADRLLDHGDAALDSHETREMLQKIRHLRYVSFSSLLSGFARFTSRLAQQLDKELAPITMEDHGVLVAPEIYLPFSKSLIHLFRNAVDHGLESPEERFDAGKEETGHIRCETWMEHGEIIIEIADDGRGLDVHSIAENAVNSGLYSAKDVAEMSQEQLWLLIFEDELSTRADVTDLSGRGVGLAAVRVETERLGGRFEIHSTAGKGTRFRFILPYREPSFQPPVETP